LNEKEHSGHAAELIFTEESQTGLKRHKGQEMKWECPFFVR